MDCGVSPLVKILPIVVILIIALILTIYDLWSLRGHQLLRGVNNVSLSLLPPSSKPIQECMRITPVEYEEGMRDHQEYKESLQNLVTYLLI